MTTAEILSGIREAFKQKNAADQKMIRLEEKAESGDARLVEMNDYAARTGEHLSESLIETFRDSGVARITADMADGTIVPALKEGHEKVVDAAVSVQEGMDKKNSIGLKPMAPEFPADRARNLAGKVAEQAEEMEEGDEYRLEDSLKWLGEPVVNFAQAAFDSFVQKNAEFRSGAGLKTTITREASGNCCPWCAALVGTYSYAETKGSNVYRRHQSCRCTVTFESGRTRQDVWSKRSWEASAEELEERRNANVRDHVPTKEERERRKNAGIEKNGNNVIISRKETGIRLNLQFFAGKDKQYGKKIGKHAKDYGLDPSSPTDRSKMMEIINDIVENKTEIRIGPWPGQDKDVIFYIKNSDVVIKKQNGEFISILKNGANTSERIKKARVV